MATAGPAPPRSTTATRRHKPPAAERSISRPEAPAKFAGRCRLSRRRPRDRRARLSPPTGLRRGAPAGASRPRHPLRLRVPARDHVTGLLPSGAGDDKLSARIPLDLELAGRPVVRAVPRPKFATPESGDAVHRGPRPQRRGWPLRRGRGQATGHRDVHRSPAPHGTVAALEC
jgi:hypothetical protein